MKLHFNRIELHNFKGVVGDLHWDFHEEPGFYFVEGINKKEPRLGANGAGKSTIFTEAPYWVLTGKTILSQRPGALVENWTNKKNVSGRLFIVLNEIEYCIERGRNPSILKINGKTVQQEEIDQLLPLSDAALRRTILLGQRSAMFLDLRPEDKSRLFSETLDLDRWLLASDRAGEQIRQEDRKLTLLRQNISLLTGTINQIRDQHEKAAQQEELFEDNKNQKIEVLATDIAEQSERIIEAKVSLSDSRKALQSVPQSDTLEVLRDEERTGRRNLGKLEAELHTIRRQEQQVNEQIEKYQESKTCPECGQVVTEEHIHQRLIELQNTAKSLTEIGDYTAYQANQLDIWLGVHIHKIKDQEKIQQQFIEISNEVKTLETVLENEQRNYDRLAKELDAVKNEANLFTILCNELEKKYETEKDQLDRQQEVEEGIVEQIEILKFWQKGFRDIRLELIDSTLLELELATNRNAQALGLEDWHIAFTTERETKSGNVSQSFTVLLYPPGQDDPIDWAAFSGGEAQRWHIAVTCGLSEVLLGRAGIEPDTEIYDEVTSYISSEGIENVLDFLRQRAFDLNRKIYLIDHHVGVGDFTSTVQVTKDATGIHIN